FRASGFRPTVLPHDGVVHRPASPPIPRQRGFPLIRDPDGTNVGSLESRLGKRLARGFKLCIPDLHGIVLDPPRLWEDLGEFTLGKRDDLARLSEDDTARAGSALVEC